MNEVAIKEEWRPFPIEWYAERYMVSNKGRVKSLPSEHKVFNGRHTVTKKLAGKVLALRENGTTVTLRGQVRSDKKRFKVAELVAKAFPSAVDGITSGEQQ